MDKVELGIHEGLTGAGRSQLDQIGVSDDGDVKLSRKEELLESLKESGILKDSRDRKREKRKDQTQGLLIGIDESGFRDQIWNHYLCQQLRPSGASQKHLPVPASYLVVAV